nr:immunoglobulin light chain junction region [Macaca mulatta]MOV96034.1 immunoglobulin light chain junction region [Macaca mulatta]MOV96287.1 immunoglobulin light chain junction region [Macaca mulatta]MOV96454.1 immunoglobulin light chain junction region [Macaca mulatta]MOV98111.1 immunoglobulin light chain junction region [Macaca mulatta]
DYYCAMWHRSASALF